LITFSQKLAESQKLKHKRKKKAKKKKLLLFSKDIPNDSLEAPESEFGKSDGCEDPGADA
jgi:hypothetical protein